MSAPAAVKPAAAAVSPPPLAIPPEKRSRGLGKALLAVIAVVVIGAGAYVLWSENQVQQILNSTLGTPSPGPNQISTACKTGLADLTDKLTELDSRLAVGLNFSDYSEMVGTARVAYDRVDISALDSTCLTLLGSPEEDALNAYIRAYNTWNDCIGKTTCTFDSIQTKVQAEWSTATSLLAAVRVRTR